MALKEIEVELLEHNSQYDDKNVCGFIALQNILSFGHVFVLIFSKKMVILIF